MDFVDISMNKYMDEISNNMDEISNNTEEK